MGCAPSTSEKIKSLNEKIKRGILLKSYNFDNMDLKSLKIMDNHLELKEISVFSAQNNKLNSVPKIFFKHLDKITKIDFSHNLFEFIDDIIYTKVSLIFLNFSYNEIDTISPFIKNFINLKELDLSHNKIAELPEESITEMKNLETFNLSNNNFNYFPENLLLIEKLETLNISYNNIKELPDSQSWEVSKIKNLDFCFNKLSTVPEKLLKYSKISILNLKGNLINRSQFMRLEGYQEFETRRKERKDQAFFKNLDVGFDICELEDN